jgi:hypothetical protein
VVKYAPGNTAPGPVVGPIDVVAGTGLGVTGSAVTDVVGDAVLDAVTGVCAEGVDDGTTAAVRGAPELMSRGTATAPTPTRRTTMAAITRMRRRGRPDP